MIRQMIKIDEEKCNGCGLCITACHEGAIDLVNGKAKLMRENYCDGLGNCLPACPTGAITFEEREAPAYDEAAVKASQATAKSHGERKEASGGCPGKRAAAIERKREEPSLLRLGKEVQPLAPVSQLGQWPVQIKLVPVNAPYFQGANLLVAADCTAFAYGNFHQDFIQGRITLIGCPKLDGEDYSEKLAAILRENEIKSVTIVRMEVPCCAGIVEYSKRALQNCGKMIPWMVYTVSTEGEIIV